MSETEVIDWPADLAPTTSEDFDLKELNAVYGDPRTGTSLRQVRSQPRWSAAWSFQNLCEVRRKKLQGLRARLRGGIGTVRLWDYADSGVSGQVGGGRFSDGTEFSDGTQFLDGVVVLRAAAVKGATTISVTVDTTITEPFLVGDKIGFPNDRLYMVTEDAVAVGGAATVKVYPPLWEAVGAGEPVVTYRPTARFYIVDPGGVSAGTNKLAAMAITFTEEVRL